MTKMLAGKPPSGVVSTTIPNATASETTTAATIAAASRDPA